MHLFLVMAALQQSPPAAGPAPYWQQRVVYQINARLDEPTFTLRGDQHLKYINHSPDTLHTISFHLYLNAFRPGSRWSDADSVEQRRRFNDLKDPDYGFNHVSNAKIDGAEVHPFFPLAPDSTIVRFTLPKALAPGDSLNVTMDWDARPSIPPRRQGRRGRSYDFAQWYPKVVVYDKYGWEEHALVPAGEFYGEFGDFYVNLDVPQDQVVGATGVPKCGDPGWEKANQAPATAVQLGRDRDPEEQRRAAASGGNVETVTCGSIAAFSPPVAPGRKQILWVARDVHNFAITMAPDYRYEGGEIDGTFVHVLYQPGDEKTWGGGIVVNNTITMLKWLGFVFGPYPWPQMTVVHRIEGGGTEFPMMEMNGSPSLGLNLHEGGHTYLMGILANNEWKEGWLDEGFTSFQTSWYEEVQAHNDGAIRGLEAFLLSSDLDNGSQPVSTVSDKFRDFNTYNNMIYSRGELFLHELKRMVGDYTMLVILRTYYARWKLHHVDEAAFKAVAEEVSHRDLSTFFAQWLHQVVLTDYAIHGARRQLVTDGWRTTIDIDRRADGIFPATVVVYAESDTAYVSIDGTREHEQVSTITRSKPKRILLDPFVESHDWNMLNNQYVFTWKPAWLSPQAPPTDVYLDHFFSQRMSRERLTRGIMPTVWYNDVGGVTFGYHVRDDYLGRFSQNSSTEFCGLRHFGVKGHEFETCGFSLSFGNPTWLHMANVSQRFSAYRIEGRSGASVRVERVRAEHSGFGPTVTTGGSINWTATHDMAYLPPTLWDNGGSVEGAVWWGVANHAGSWDLNLQAKVAGGVMYRNPSGGITTDTRYDAQPYARPELTASARRTLGKSWSVAARAYLAAVYSNDPVLSQRRIFVAGADPYESMANPFVRSVGAPLLRDDCWCRWHTPGDGNLRGYNQSLSTDRLATVNAELERAIFHAKTAWLSRIGFTLFGDAGYTGVNRGTGGIGDLTEPPTPSRWLADAGVGLRLSHRIGTTAWTSRLDLPVYVSDPQWAFAHRLGNFGLNRLLLSFSPVIR